MSDSVVNTPAAGESLPLVSVILPVYNGERFVKDTLESAQRQTYANFEIVVVDDGSTDRTWSLVKAIAAKDPRVRIIHQPNGGVASARNRGLAAARGDFIAPLDADDLWDPAKLEHQVRRIQEAGKETGMVYCWWVWIDEEGSVLDRSPEWRIEGQTRDLLLQINFTGNASVPLYRRSCLEAVGGYDTTLEDRGGRGCEDWDVALKVAERFRVAVAPELLVGYRRLPDSMSTQCAVMQRSQALLVEGTSARRPDLPPELRQKSYDQFALYIAGVLFRSGAYLQSFTWAIRAWRSGLFFKILPYAIRVLATRLFLRRGAGRIRMLPGKSIAGAAIPPALIPYDELYPSGANASSVQQKSLLGSGVLQAVCLLIAVLFVGWAHRTNDGLWFQGDSPRHAANGFFWYDLLTTLPAHPIDFALRYYARYPIINPLAYPPLFYVFEGLAFRVFGPSPEVAKTLVLAFGALAAIYTMLWCRRWISAEAGWTGFFFMCLPGVVTWSNAVMLNIPSVAVGTAALYHWRRFLESGRKRQLLLAAGMAAAETLIYYPGAIALAIGVAWLFLGAKTSPRARVLYAVGALSFAALTVAAIALVSPQLVERHIPKLALLTRIGEWTYYPATLPILFGPITVAACLIAIIASLNNRELRTEALFLLSWILVPLIGLSLVPAKEQRYILILAPALLSSIALGIAGARRVLKRIPKPLVSASLMFACLVSLILTSFRNVPGKEGFRAIAAYVGRNTPHAAVLYDGYHDGLFGFYLRASDPHYQRRLVLGQQVLYRYHQENTFYWIERLRVKSAAEVAPVLRAACGCEWIAVEVGKESQWTEGQRLLRQAVQGPEFQPVWSFPIAAYDAERVDLYRLAGPIAPVSTVRVTPPGFGGRSFDGIQPISR